MTNVKIKKGDTVKLIAGDDKGKSGIIKSVDLKKMRVLVEGVNMVKRHTKPSASKPEGGIIEKEAPIHVSNVMLVDGQGNATRVGKKSEANGWVRVSKKSGEIIK
ncbi:MAG: 50S ribosomal protein L24 [Chitinophagales bacterium]